MGGLEVRLRDYRLTTAEILYHFPDYPRLLQSFIWQEYDLAPGYPVLRKFLDFWESNIEGRVHSVMVASAPLLKPAGIRLVDACFTLH
ncbi:MAG: Usg family protein [Proteobacteria bacterium]|nr:Usg family protein [Pseudomonadota bacterium]